MFVKQKLYSLFLGGLIFGSVEKNSTTKRGKEQHEGNGSSKTGIPLA